MNINEIKWLKDEDPEYIIDPLTKLINRNFIIKIVEGLIEEKTPFSLMILDLDNFKKINDSYGHMAGDFILKSVGENIEKYYKDIYIGRFGGDEIILIVPGLDNYNDTHNFLEKLYERNKIFRRYYNENTKDIYLTATLGSSNYPKDGLNFEELFNKADKALYRGKSKGRNCYIIYVESKHKDIIIKEKVNRNVIEYFNSAIRMFDVLKGENNKFDIIDIIKNSIDFLYSELHSSGAYFLTNEGKILSNNYEEFKKTEIAFQPHIDLLLKGDKSFFETPLTKYKMQDPDLREFLEKRKIQSILIVKIDGDNDFGGYILICEKEITRVWQESEVALVMYVAALLELEIIKLNK